MPHRAKRTRLAAGLRRAMLGVMPSRAPQSTQARAVETWRKGYERLLDETCRARLHDLRASLNGLSVGLEVVRMATAGQVGADEAAAAARMADGMGRDLSAAVASIEGLERIVTAAPPGSHVELREAVDWAVTVTGPVLRRRRMRLSPPATLPAQPADARTGVAIGLALVETAGVAPPDTELALRWVAGTNQLLLRYPHEGPAPPTPLTEALLSLVLDRPIPWRVAGRGWEIELAGARR